jgi:hypothetical protein
MSSEHGITFLANLTGSLARGAIFSAIFTRVGYGRTSACIADDFVEGPFVGTATQRIMRTEVSFVKERARGWLRPAGLLITSRRRWPGKFILIPAGVDKYQQIKEELLQWEPAAGRKA